MPTITLTVSAAQATRITTALGRDLGLNRPATASEVKDWLISQVRHMVEVQERQVEARKITVGNLGDIT